LRVQIKGLGFRVSDIESTVEGVVGFRTNGSMIRI